MGFLEQSVEDLARGNVVEVKVVLATVVLALAAYQLLLAAVVYGRLRLPFLSAAAAAWTHRASGDAIVVLIVAVATMCLALDGFDEGGAHSVAGTAVLGLVAAKVATVRAGGRLGRLLPLLGIALAAALAIVWLTSAGDFLGVAG